MYPAYWVAAVTVVAATLRGSPMGQPAAITAATVLFVAGGLPHGAYDLALFRRAIALDRYGITLAASCYVAVAALMAIMWMIMPLAALILFLAVAAVHFGEDWDMLDEPLLRLAAGLAVIAAPAIGHRADVSRLFVAMSDGRATFVAQIIVAAAPVTLMVTAVSIGIAWRSGNRQWASAMALCLALLLILPPVVGFALFFVFLHSPRHLSQARATLGDMTPAQWLSTGVLLSGAAIIGWWALQGLSPAPMAWNMTAQAFQLLASVAMPHFLLSHWLAKRLHQ
ncbi:hypothetical protein GCM10011529_31420 [Polymorphobacter glacialis]|uniref:Probable beta-carotene 15,15'-dioxygenase n=1 Tax=Sandarakinorhabdus glacialis TaxID=1614636 RepID=A0A917A1T7_9SPHN|nr:Brp/Blh family beta-carotene 15,15'-dioxygenase [Polymorphobacter glacialis]GGE22537.1 hypothetical protein GCM10011529_31420 [Polymorphobacter glacialis]